MTQLESRRGVYWNIPSDASIGLSLLPITEHIDFLTWI